MKKVYSLLGILFFAASVFAQNVGIGTTTPAASALLELQSSNKGLLLPRVADTNAVPSPAKGLLIFANATNSTWFYDGAKWQEATTDGLWTKYQDSIAITQKKYVGVNTDYSIYPPRQGIQANGSLLMHQEMLYTKAARTIAQAYTMNNLATIANYTDSVVRIFDPGGVANYINNSQGNIRLANLGSIAGYQISFNPADFGIAAGDTLWIGKANFPACRTDYVKRFTNTTLAPADFNVNDFTFLIFRSNADNINSNGFDITCRAIFPKPTNEPNITPLGNALMFNLSKGAFLAGINNTLGVAPATVLGNNTTAIGTFSTSMGSYTTASGFEATAMGYNTTASGAQATAIGKTTTASGGSSTAMGNNTTATGENSTAMGNTTIAKAYSSLAIGSYNDSIISSSAFSWVNTDPLLYIGNSQNGTPRSNAMVVYKNANVDINGFTRLGKASEDAPIIKMKEIIGIGPNGDNATIAILHGLTASKIISVSIMSEFGAGSGDLIPPNYKTGNPSGNGFEYTFQVRSNDIFISNVNGNSAGLTNRAVKILITYKE
jgi:Head domain of trimeric autotransporter adhesin